MQILKMPLSRNVLIEQWKSKMFIKKLTQRTICKNRTSRGNQNTRQGVHLNLLKVIKIKIYIQ